MKFAFIGGLASILLTETLAVSQPMDGQTWLAQTPIYRSKYYAIQTDLEVEEAKKLAVHMDATFESYMRLFLKLPIRVTRPSTLDLYLFANQRDYLNVLTTRFKNDGTGSWGKCITMGRRISLVGWRGEHTAEEVKPLLQHEGFHQVSSHLFSDTPLWAEEGMAELFERGVMVGGELALGEFSIHDKKRLQELVQRDQVIPFDRFFAIDSEEWSQRVRAADAGGIYLQAWSMVHFFVFADGGKYEKGYLNFLVLLNRGVEWKQAFVTAFGMPDFDAMQAKWQEHIEKTPPSDYRETIRRFEFLAAGVADLQQRDIYPASLDELEQELKKASFTHESNLFGEPRRISALDPAVFEVPYATETADRKFVLDYPRGAPAGPRRGTAPANMLATGLDPQVFAVTWRRQGNDYEPVFLIGSAAQKVLALAKKPTRPDERDAEERPAEKPPQAPELRTWTSANGKYTTLARLKDYRDGVAQLETADGASIPVPYDKLSPVDQRYLDGWTGGTP